MPTFNARKELYQQLWDSMEITRLQQITDAARKIIQGRTQYEELERLTGAPWYFIGALHMRESSCNFNTHLHNGDSLARRTRQVPSGRPAAPPANGTRYTWLESAKDALAIKGLDQFIDWTIPRLLYEAERYNGWGYTSGRKPNSPYLWAGSNHYTKGKYIADHKYSASVIDSQPGVAPMMRMVLQITGASAIPGSSSQWLTSLSKWVFPAGGGLAAFVSQFAEFVMDWRTVTLLVLAGLGAGAVFWILERKKLKEYREGRYVPSGEVKAEESQDELA